MPHIIDYQTVLATLTNSGLQCTYPNSGSFAPQDTHARIVGWTLGPDPTITDAMKSRVREQPSLQTMLDQLTRLSGDHLPGEIWVMPASHWAYELCFGNAQWLPNTLKSVGVEVPALLDRNDGSAIAFAATESEGLQKLIGDLLTLSTASDFTTAWPGHATVALLHHHQQIWWRTTNELLFESLK